MQLDLNVLESFNCAWVFFNVKHRFSVINRSFVSSGFDFLTVRESKVCTFHITHMFYVQVGYIVMMDPSTGERTNLLRMKGAKVVGAYHPLIDEDLMRMMHRYSFHSMQKLEV